MIERAGSWPPCDVLCCRPELCSICAGVSKAERASSTELSEEQLVRASLSCMLVRRMPTFAQYVRQRVASPVKLFGSELLPQSAVVPGSLASCEPQHCNPEPQCPACSVHCNRRCLLRQPLDRRLALMVWRKPRLPEQRQLRCTLLPMRLQWARRCGVHGIALTMTSQQTICRFNMWVLAI